MREIVLDTETTGMDPSKGDRLVEIGCVELDNFIPTGRTFHVYINPERDVPAEAEAIHGLSTKFLKDKPVFSQIYTEMLDFIGDAKLCIHNAEFDIKFLNAELKNVGHKGFILKEVTDTLKIAREKFPGSPANLDALCRRFNIDNSKREFHGALLDAQLLAEIYLELCGGRQHGFSLAEAAEFADHAGSTTIRTRKQREQRHFPVSEQDLKSHAELVGKLTDALWKDLDAA